MATIKDVALLAGVSIGTVSNVLNGKTKNLDLISRVEEAMTELGYRPDANARSLKRDKSTLIGIILPNSINPEFASFISHVESMLYERGYGILLNFTYDNRFIEQKAIEKCLEQRVDGIILLPVINSRKDLFPNRRNTPILIVSPREDASLNGDAIFLDYSQAFQQTMDYFNSNGKKDIAMILDGSYLYNKKIIDIYNNYCSNEELLKVTDYSKERGFRAAYELFYNYSEIDGVIAGNYLIAQGIEKAAKLLNKKDINIIVVKDSNWIDDEGRYPAQIALSQKKVARQVVKRILTAIENPKVHEPLIEKIPAEFKEIQRTISGLKRAESPVKLKLAMYDSPTSNSLKILSEVYKQSTGISIGFDLLKYNELENIVYEAQEVKKSKYDGFMVDITWIDELVKNQFLTPLPQSKIDFNKFIAGLEQQCELYNGRYHAVPIMSGTQLLFYQKDLFESKQLRRHFLIKNDKELEVPTTWTEFNMVAEFFTKTFNSKSPTPYGISTVSGDNIYTTISYLNRLWSYGSDVFDEDGNVIINNKNALMALKNFVNSYKYATVNHLNSWDEVAYHFKEGKAAMAILYDSYAMDLNDYTKSKVAGNLGVQQIPGGTPVLGGWSLGISKNSTNIEQMENFIAWCSSDQTVIPLLLLGGSTLKKNYYKSSELEDTYPWKYNVLDSYRKSRKRILPNVKIKNKGRNYLYNHVISKQIMKVLDHKIDEEQALIKIESDLDKLINGKS